MEVGSDNVIHYIVSFTHLPLTLTYSSSTKIMNVLTVFILFVFVAVEQGRAIYTIQTIVMFFLVLNSN